MRIVTEDAEGRVIDLHELRTTLGTNLARAGLAPEVARMIMRHAHCQTTLKHYMMPGLIDTRKVVEQLPELTPGWETETATGATARVGPDGCKPCQQ